MCDNVGGGPVVEGSLSAGAFASPGAATLEEEELARGARGTTYGALCTRYGLDEGGSYTLIRYVT